MLVFNQRFTSSSFFFVFVSKHSVILDISYNITDVRWTIETEIVLTCKYTWILSCSVCVNFCAICNITVVTTEIWHKLILLRWKTQTQQEDTVCATKQSTCPLYYKLCTKSFMIWTYPPEKWVFALTLLISFLCVLCYHPFLWVYIFVRCATLLWSY